MILGAGPDAGPIDGRFVAGWWPSNLRAWLVVFGGLLEGGLDASQFIKTTSRWRSKFMLIVVDLYVLMTYGYCVI